ncbi:hypothetical protein FA13DRAFT_1916968 [Coprinellus micaceus]|uniref:Mucoidy inhibitor A n=1 Tax=Coprinellus micaceus TaxID=71717 RepID=A0A4Y7SN82_COPMI|nr:hypothetical protein FA13DRAFT_1916968 [Coprinellus micaceus]
MVFGANPASETPGPAISSGGLFGRTDPPRPLFPSTDDDRSDGESEAKAEPDTTDIKLGRGQSNEGKIVSVSVYFNRAEVARSYKFHATAGQHQVRVSGLPTVLDESSIRVEGHGSAIVQDVTVSKKDPTPTRKAKPAPKEVPKTSPKLDELEAKSSDLFSELERYKKTLMALDWYLEGHTRQASTIQSGSSNTVAAPNITPLAVLPLLDEYNAAAEKYDGKANAIRRQLKKLEAEIEDERKNVEKAAWESGEPKAKESKVDRKTLARVTVGIYAEEDTEVELVLKYFVSGTGWDAVYDVRASTTSKENPVEIMYKAAIQQFTGEDWTDVSITLETATPSSLFSVQSLPSLAPWNITLYKPPPPPAFPPPQPPVAHRQSVFGAVQNPDITQATTGGIFGGGGAFGASRSAVGGGLFGSPPSNATGGGLFGAFGQSTAGSFGANPPNAGTTLFGATHAPSAGGSPFGGGGANPPQREPEPLAVSKADVTSQGSVNATFRVPGTIGIPSDGASHNVTIVSLTPTAKLAWMAVPSVDARAHLTARITNDSEFTLLKGVANVFVDGTFVTKSTIPLVSPEEAFTLSLGLDPSIRLAYSPPLKKHSTSGLLTKTSLTSFTQRITIHNTKSVGIENLKILTRIPVSLDSPINVKLIEPLLPLPPQSTNGNTPSVGEKAAPRVRVKEGVIARWHPWAFSEGGGVSVSAKNEKSAGLSEDEDETGAVEHLGKDGKIEWLCKVDAKAKLELTLRFEVGVPISEIAIGL